MSSNLGTPTNSEGSSNDPAQRKAESSEAADLDWLMLPSDDSSNVLSAQATSPKHKDSASSPKTTQISIQSKSEINQQLDEDEEGIDELDWLASLSSDTFSYVQTPITGLRSSGKDTKKEPANASNIDWLILSDLSLNNSTESSSDLNPISSEKSQPDSLKNNFTEDLESMDLDLGEGDLDLPEDIDIDLLEADLNSNFGTPKGTQILEDENWDISLGFGLEDISQIDNLDDFGELNLLGDLDSDLDLNLGSSSELDFSAFNSPAEPSESESTTHESSLSLDNIPTNEEILPDLNLSDEENYTSEPNVFESLDLEYAEEDINESNEMAQNFIANDLSGSDIEINLASDRSEHYATPSLNSSEILSLDYQDVQEDSSLSEEVDIQSQDWSYMPDFEEGESLSEEMLLDNPDAETLDGDRSEEFDSLELDSLNLNYSDSFQDYEAIDDSDLISAALDIGDDLLDTDEVEEFELSINLDYAETRTEVSPDQYEDEFTYQSPNEEIDEHLSNSNWSTSTGAESNDEEDYTIGSSALIDDYTDEEDYTIGSSALLDDNLDEFSSNSITENNLDRWAESTDNNNFDNNIANDAFDLDFNNQTNLEAGVDVNNNVNNNVDFDELAEVESSLEYPANLSDEEFDLDDNLDELVVNEAELVDNLTEDVDSLTEDIYPNDEFGNLGDRESLDESLPNTEQFSEEDLLDQDEILGQSYSDDLEIFEELEAEVSESAFAQSNQFINFDSEVAEPLEDFNVSEFDGELLNEESINFESTRDLDNDLDPITFSTNVLPTTPSLSSITELDFDLTEADEQLDSDFGEFEQNNYDDYSLDEEVSADFPAPIQASEDWSSPLEFVDLSEPLSEGYASPVNNFELEELSESYEQSFVEPLTDFTPEDMGDYASAYSAASSETFTPLSGKQIEKEIIVEPHTSSVESALEYSDISAGLANIPVDQFADSFDEGIDESEWEKSLEDDINQYFEDDHESRPTTFVNIQDRETDLEPEEDWPTPSNSFLDDEDFSLGLGLEDLAPRSNTVSTFITNEAIAPPPLSPPVAPKLPIPKVDGNTGSTLNIQSFPQHLNSEESNEEDKMGLLDPFELTGDNPYSDASQSTPRSSTLPNPLPLPSLPTLPPLPPKPSLPRASNNTSASNLPAKKNERSPQPNHPSQAQPVSPPGFSNNRTSIGKTTNPKYELPIVDEDLDLRETDWSDFLDLETEISADLLEVDDQRTQSKMANLNGFSTSFLNSPTGALPTDNSATAARAGSNNPRNNLPREASQGFTPSRGLRNNEQNIQRPNFTPQVIPFIPEPPKPESKHIKLPSLRPTISLETLWQKYLKLPVTVMAAILGVWGISSIPVVQRFFLETGLKTSLLKDMSGKNLAGINLKNVKLEQVNFSKAVLEGANLESANLKGANLVGANLDGTNLTKANLDGARLVDASLVWSNLQGASVNFVDMSNADLTRANLTSAKLEGTNFKNTKIELKNKEKATKLDAPALLMWQIVNIPTPNRNLASQDLTGFNLNSALLKGANLSISKLAWVDLTKADLRDANLAEADLTGANLESANLAGANLVGVIWSNDRVPKTSNQTICPDGRRGPCKF